MSESLRVAIVTFGPFVNENGRCLVPPAEWKSLMQWIGFIDHVTLLAPEATDIGNTVWQLREGAGVVVPLNDVRALVGVIASVPSNLRLREELSVKGYQRSLSYTLEQQKQEIEDFVKHQVGALYSQASRKS